MLSEKDRTAIVELAGQYQVERILLFGSALRSDAAQDIDLAVDGIKPELFFRFYGDLLFRLSKPVDLVDLSDDTLFTRLIRQEGQPIYG